MRLTRSEIQYIKKQVLIERYDKYSDWSYGYQRAIATLAEKLRKSDFFKKCDLVEITKSDQCWRLFKAQFPQARAIADEVETELNYELSFNQCCNTLYWLCNHDPLEWQELL